MGWHKRSACRRTGLYVLQILQVFVQHGKCVSSPDLAFSDRGDLSLDPHSVSLQDNLWEMLWERPENCHGVGS